MRAARILVSLLLAVFITSCTSYYDVPIEMPIQAKLDITPFTRVLVAGFAIGLEEGRPVGEALERAVSGGGWERAADE